jgi:serine protease Do
MAGVVCASVFAQTGAGALRDYVGLINQSYHPDIVAYFEKIKARLDKKGEKDAVKAIDRFLKGSTGSGFIISDASGQNYILTNNHVVAQAYDLSITFERQDGFKKSWQGLKIIAADEETDLALLAFTPGDKPVERGLAFFAGTVEEGEEVFSAGFPGLGTAALWQFGNGRITNAIARFPKSLDDPTLMGPFIQHSAQVDPGNSGGPLLVPQKSAPSGYAVAGINTLSALWRQAANYAVPVNTVEAFVNAALHSRPETYRAQLDQRLSSFIEGFAADKAVYPHIAGYLSSDCIGENAEYAISEVLEKAPRQVQQGFIDKLEDSIVGGMGYAVGWIIENAIHKGGAAIKAVVKEVNGSGEDYNVIFTINGKDYDSTWKREYGIWRIRTFGNVASGDKSLVAKKEARREAEQNLRLDSKFHVEAGYASLFDKASAAAYAALDFYGMGLKLYFAGPDFWAIGGFVSIRGSFPLGKVGLMPYARAGIDYQSDKDYQDFKDYSDNNVSAPSVSFMVQAGLKVTTSYVPGLFGGLAFQYNLINMNEFMGFDPKYNDAMDMALSVTAGYAF